MPRMLLQVRRSRASGVGHKVTKRVTNVEYGLYADLWSEDLKIFSTNLIHEGKNASASNLAIKFVYKKHEVLLRR